MRIPTYKVVAMVGYQKAGVRGPSGQIIDVSIADPLRQDEWMSVRVGDGDGIYLHQKQNKPMVWWHAELWLAAKDVIKITTKVGILGQGTDEERTMDLLFAVDPNAPLVSVSHPGLGYGGYPILRGRVREIARSSKADTRRMKIEQHLDSGWDETRVLEREDLPRGGM